jgi:hypothetical protein
VLNSVVSVAIQVARNQSHPAENVLHWADVKRWHLFSSPFIQHWNTFHLQAAVQSQADLFKGAEEHQGEHPTGGAQGAIEGELQSVKISGTHYTISGTIRVDKYCSLCSPELLQGC